MNDIACLPIKIFSNATAALMYIQISMLRFESDSLISLTHQIVAQ